MSRKIDLNADMGEGYGRWSIGDDTALLEHVTSANIACGLHAGDPDVMAGTMAAALERGANLGAHPGFPDLQGFGRRRMTLPEASLRNMICYQLGAAEAMARAVGGRLRHFKLHGALSNMASEDPALARVCYETALDFDPDLVILILPLTAMEEAMQSLGGTWAGEIFADRAYNEDATLVDRSHPGAMIRDPDEAAANMAAMVRDQAIICASGKRLACRIDTICVHGDSPESLEIARTVRAHLQDAGNTVCPL